MASSINATTASGGGVITTADATGNLNIQANGANVISILNDGTVGIGTSTISTGNKLAVYGGNIQIGTTGSGLRFPDNTMQTTAAFGNIQVFTSDGTFTVPAGVTKVKVTVVGSGAGGRSANNSTSQGGGGAGGAAIKVITGLTPGGTVAVTVGAGGAANTGGNTSSFGSYCSATGGLSPASGNGPPGGAGGTATGGDINFTGGAGCGGNGVSGTVAGSAGNGGSSIFGGAGLGALNTNAVNTAGAGASGTGAGGGGGCGGPGTGGAGGSGIVIVEY